MAGAITILWFINLNIALRYMYADLILPLNLPQTLTYGIPLGMQPYIQRGMRVEVGLGKNKQYAGIVVQIHNHKPDAYQVKPIRSLIDKQPIVDSVQLAFWEWVASYYMASPGEVMNAALPAHLKLMSETRIQWIAAFLPQSPNEVVTRVITQLQTHSVLTLSEISQITGAKDLPFVLQELLDNEWVSVNDHLEDPYKPKIEKIIELHPNYAQEGQLKSLFSMLERAPKQLALLMCYIEIHQKKKYVRQAELLERADATSAQLKMMTEKGILVVKEVAVDRLSGYVIDTPAAISFTVAQKTAYDRLSHLLLTKNVVLLHGVTGSGKTLLYIEKIKEYINNGYQALFLLPEIALTQHLVQRLHVHFGESMGVYHSKFSNHERVEIWENVRKGKYKVVVGARSAIWLPYPKLGVIIADEEHDVSYKQKDPAPRFHARDAAIYLATLHGAKVILGSATPSIESLQHVKAGKYAYCSLSERYNNVPLPAIRILDARTIGTVKSHRRQIITPELEQAIAQALQHKKQVVLFQNKRGYTPIQLCTTCGKVVQCKNCSVALSYHKATDKLHCHFCGLKINIANYCASCGSNTLISKSYGTEKIEEEVQFLFPKARIARMDTDSMKGKNSAEELLYKLLNHQIDILVGT
ncbi:MAG: primosomal protein N', partial [Chitinophagia bacterium]|nr:primosomal protein N' [Chitinophagia bacterium]